MFDNLDALRQLQRDVINGLKEFEFALRREIEGTSAERLYLAGSNDVPEEYRQLVEEYYRTLSSQRR
ncbi:MAG TPA: hypothetical protein VNZ57_04385 [Longimicrobiales bacterium]|nr:hypothetical protein [Longimicrobiales bacterium]